jgi:hypothetical protein
MRIVVRTHADHAGAEAAQSGDQCVWQRFCSVRSWLQQGVLIAAVLCSILGPAFQVLIDKLQKCTRTVSVFLQRRCSVCGTIRVTPRT